MSAETVAPVEGVKTDSTALVAVQTALTEFDAVSAGIADLRTKYADVVFDCKTPAGMTQAREARIAIREPRYKVEQIRKGAKAPVLALGRNIDERAKWITDQLLAIEGPVDDMIRAEETRREQLKREHEERERARVAAIDEAIELIRSRPVDAAGRNSTEIAAMIADLEAEPIGESFAELKERAELAKSIALSKLRAQHERAVAAEAESQRLAAERAELERRQAEQDERERVAAAEEVERRAMLDAEERAARERIAAQEAEARRQREEQDRIAREKRDAEAAILKADRDRLEEQQRAARLAEEEKDRAARAETERVERETRARAEAEAAVKAETERQERETREAAERAERQRQAAIDGGRAHLQTFVDLFGHVPLFANFALVITGFLQETNPDNESVAAQGGKSTPPAGANPAPAADPGVWPGPGVGPPPESTNQKPAGLAGAAKPKRVRRSA